MGSISNLAIYFLGVASPAVQSNVAAIKVMIGAPPPPTLTINGQLPKLSYDSRKITVAGSVKGRLYYYVDEADTNSISLDEIKGNISQNIFTIQSRSDYLTHLYDSPRYLRLGVVNLSTGYM